MKYDISKPTAPAMPNLGKGTECIKILLSQVSDNMQEPMVPMFFPVLGAHISGTEFQYPDFSWKEPTGIIICRRDARTSAIIICKQKETKFLDS